MTRHNPNIVSRFWSWWRHELAQLFFPMPPVGADQHPRRIVISLQHDRVSALEESATDTKTIIVGKGTESAASADVSQIAKHLSTLSRRRPVGLRIDPELCLRRKVTLPRAGLANVEDILRLELERATPFSHEDIYSAHYISDDASKFSDQVTAHHLIVKRNIIDPVLQTLSEFDIRPAFVDCWSATGDKHLPINFFEHGQPHGNLQARSIKSAAVLGLAGLLALSAAGFVSILRHQSALEEVKTAVSELSSTAQNVRVMIEESRTRKARIQYLQGLKITRERAARTLETVTALLPNSVWLTDFRVDDTTLNVSGYAKTVSPLITVFERAPQFENAKLSAPVVLDARLDRERFSLRADLKTKSLRQPEDRSLDGDGGGG